MWLIIIAILGEMACIYAWHLRLGGSRLVNQKAFLYFVRAFGDFDGVGCFPICSGCITWQAAAQIGIHSSLAICTACFGRPKIVRCLINSADLFIKLLLYIHVSNLLTPANNHLRSSKASSPSSPLPRRPPRLSLHHRSPFPHQTTNLCTPDS